MKLDLKKLAPWNWFKKEQEAATLPIERVRTDANVPAVVTDPLWQLHRELDRLIEASFRGWTQSLLQWPTVASEGVAILRPSLDIEETDKEYIIRVEVPGVEEKDLQLTLEDDVLWIRGEKRQEQTREEANYHVIERRYGSFERALNLPADADPEAITATFKNGVLRITIAKRSPQQTAEPRRIPVQS